MLQNIG